LTFCKYKSCVIFSGFPYKNILQSSSGEVITLVLITLTCFLLPILASCAISTKLIFFTKKNFLNKVDLLKKESSEPKLARNEQPKQPNENTFKVGGVEDAELKTTAHPILSILEESLSEMSNTEPNVVVANAFNYKEHNSEQTDSKILVSSNINLLSNSTPINRNVIAEDGSIEKSYTNVSKYIRTRILTSNLSEATTRQDQDVEEITHFDSEIEKRNKAQVFAAKRCLLINLVLGVLFILSFGLIVVFTSSMRGYFCAVTLNIMKALLPTLTTIANFGTIQSVILQYWKHFQNSNLFCHLCKK
jgi:hypothetical protein